MNKAVPETAIFASMETTPVEFSRLSIPPSGTPSIVPRDDASEGLAPARKGWEALSRRPPLLWESKGW
jgi:hypothetical protein